MTELRNPQESGELYDLELIGDDESFQAIAKGREGWIEESDSYGVFLTDTPRQIDDLLRVQRTLTLAQMVPPDLIGRELESFEVTIKLKFKNTVPSSQDSPEAA